eukprot:gene11955-18448_t
MQASPPSPTGSSPKRMQRPMPLLPPSNVVLREALTTLGCEWAERIRDNSKKEAAKESVVYRLAKEWGSEKKFADVLRVSVVVLLIGGACWFAGIESVAYPCGCVAMAVLAVVFGLRKRNRMKVCKLVDHIISTVEIAETLHFKRGSPGSDITIVRMRLQVISTRMLMDAVLITESGLNWYPPTQEQILSELVSLDNGCRGLLSQPFNVVVPPGPSLAEAQYYATNPINLSASLPASTIAGFLPSSPLRHRYPSPARSAAYSNSPSRLTSSLSP